MKQMRFLYQRHKWPVKSMAIFDMLKTAHIFLNNKITNTSSNNSVVVMWKSADIMEKVYGQAGKYMDITGKSLDMKGKSMDTAGKSLGTKVHVSEKMKNKIHPFAPWHTKNHCIAYSIGTLIFFKWHHPLGYKTPTIGMDRMYRCTVDVL